MASEVYDNFYYKAKLNPKLKDFLQNLENETTKSGEKINFIIAIIKSTKEINKIIKFPEYYLNYIVKNQDKIITKKMLKYNLESFKNKNKVKLLIYKSNTTG